jgi:N-acyl-L-homoserine lactone synthetase
MLSWAILHVNYYKCSFQDCDWKAEMKKVNKDYLEKVASFSEEKIERLLSRFRLELVRYFEVQKLSIEEAIAIQLEVENEKLKEWRENRIKINEVFKYS